MKLGKVWRIIDPFVLPKKNSKVVSYFDHAWTNESPLLNKNNLKYQGEEGVPFRMDNIVVPLQLFRTMIQKECIKKLFVKDFVPRKRGYNNRSVWICFLKKGM